MMAFFDSLVQREVEGWTSNTDLSDDIDNDAQGSGNDDDTETTTTTQSSFSRATSQSDDNDSDDGNYFYLVSLLSVYLDQSIPLAA